MRLRVDWGNRSAERARFARTRHEERWSGRMRTGVGMKWRRQTFSEGERIADSVFPENRAEVGGDAGPPEGADVGGAEDDAPVWEDLGLPDGVRGMDALLTEETLLRDCDVFFLDF